MVESIGYLWACYPQNVTRPEKMFEASSQFRSLRFSRDTNFNTISFYDKKVASLDTFKTTQRPPVLARQNGNLQSFRKRTTAKLQGESIHFRYFRSRMSSYSPNESQKIWRFFCFFFLLLTLPSSQPTLSWQADRRGLARLGPVLSAAAELFPRLLSSSPLPLPPGAAHIGLKHGCFSPVANRVSATRLKHGCFTAVATSVLQTP